MNKIKILLLAASLPALLFSGLSISAETASAIKNDSLRSEPFADAKLAGSFNRGDSLVILKKQGAWLQVKAKNATGWVRLLSVKRTSSGGNQASGVLAVASGRAGTGQVVSTTGVRGLSEQELKAAKFSETEVKTLENYTQSIEQGNQFASAANLKAITFAIIDAPKSETK